MSILDRTHYEGNPLDQIEDLTKRIAALERMVLTHYKGISASDFSTAELPNPGDYGFQTADNEIQVNCNGTIRAISTAAL